MRRKPPDQAMEILRGWSAEDLDRVRCVIRATDWSPELILADPIMWQLYDLDPDEVPRVLKPPEPPKKQPYARLSMTLIVVEDEEGAAWGVTDPTVTVNEPQEPDGAVGDPPDPPADAGSCPPGR